MRSLGQESCFCGVGKAAVLPTIILGTRFRPPGSLLCVAAREASHNIISACGVRFRTADTSSIIVRTFDIGFTIEALFDIGLTIEA